jgi:hypothetical protein
MAETIRSKFEEGFRNDCQSKLALGLMEANAWIFIGRWLAREAPSGWAAGSNLGTGHNPSTTLSWCRVWLSGEHLESLKWY